MFGVPKLMSQHTSMMCPEAKHGKEGSVRCGTIVLGGAKSITKWPLHVYVNGFFLCTLSPFFNVIHFAHVFLLSPFLLVPVSHQWSF